MLHLIVSLQSNWRENCVFEWNLMHFWHKFIIATNNLNIIYFSFSFYMHIFFNLSRKIIIIVIIIIIWTPLIWKERNDINLWIWKNLIIINSRNNFNNNDGNNQNNSDKCRLIAIVAEYVWCRDRMLLCDFMNSPPS